MDSEKCRFCGKEIKKWDGIWVPTHPPAASAFCRESGSLHEPEGHSAVSEQGSAAPHSYIEGGGSIPDAYVAPAPVVLSGEVVATVRTRGETRFVVAMEDGSFQHVSVSEAKQC